jgi:hypothetical protein
MATFIDFSENKNSTGKYGKFAPGLTKVKFLTPPFKRTASFKDGSSSEKLSCAVFNLEANCIQIVDVPKAVQQTLALHAEVSGDKVWDAKAPVFAVQRSGTTKEDTRYSATGLGQFSPPPGKTYADLASSAMAMVEAESGG